MSIERSGDGSTIRHPELVQDIKDIMSLSEQYVVGVVDHLESKEIMNVPQVIFISNVIDSWDLTRLISARSGSVTTRSSTYNNIHTKPFGPFRMKKEESDFETFLPKYVSYGVNSCTSLVVQQLISSTVVHAASA